jgi:hypothetical protein
MGGKREKNFFHEVVVVPGQEHVGGERAKLAGSVPRLSFYELLIHLKGS